MLHWHLMDTPALELINIHKRFPNVHAVYDLCLRVKSGEIYALIGPNGAGKTTTVKMITGLVAPSEGTLKVFSHDVATEPVLAKKDIGYIPDDPFIYEYLTGREFLEFVGDLYGLSRKETQDRLNTLLSLYNLETVINGQFADYSRGNKQKTAIIAALLHQPKLLVIDEPIVGLDVQSQKLTLKLLRDFAKKGGSVFLCTHTLSVAESLADRIGILKEGKLIEEGTLEALRKITKQSQACLEDLYLRATGDKP